MKKRIIIAVAFAACLALCAAVWLQNKFVEKAPALLTPPAVTATKPEAPEMPEIEEIIIPEEEKSKTTEPEQVEVVAPAPEPTPVHAPSIEETIAVPEQELTPAPVLPDTPPEKMVYVPGFGWIESQGPNQVEYAEDMYENGNKIGLMN